MKELIASMEDKMKMAIQSLRGELAKLRTGRASPALLDAVHVDYYGSNVPVSQVANVTTPDARTLQIAPWETSMLPVVEKAILAANIGMTPQNDGKLLRVNLPALTEDRRKEMVKLVKKMGEEGKVQIRNHRRDANDHVKKLEKSKDCSEDDAKRNLEQIQKLTDARIADLDKVISEKEKEILSI